MSELVFRPIDYGDASEPLAADAAHLVIGVADWDPRTDEVGEYKTVVDGYSNYCVVQRCFPGLLAVGSVNLSSVDDDAYLENIAVKRDVHRRGIGRFLLSKLERKVEATGIEIVKVNSLPDAVGFYEKCGYKPVTKNNPDVMEKRLV